MLESKEKSTRVLVLVIIWLFLGILAMPTRAEDIPSDEVAPSTTPPLLDIQSLQPIQGGQGNLPIINPYTNEIIDPNSLKPKEKTWWEKIYPYALDVAIGVGAALVTFAVIKLVQMKKQKSKIQK